MLKSKGKRQDFFFFFQKYIMVNNGTYPYNHLSFATQPTFSYASTPFFPGYINTSTAALSSAV